MTNLFDRLTPAAMEVYNSLPESTQQLIFDTLQTKYYTAMSYNDARFICTALQCKDMFMMPFLFVDVDRNYAAI